MIYTGQADEYGGLGHTKKVVLNLMSNYLNAGHALYMDNFYNSFGLAKELLEANTYCTGTLRAGRKHTPKEITDVKLKKGETKAVYKDNVMIGKWKENNRDVLYISTEFKNYIVEARNRRGVVKEKPLPIAKYNKFMSGIDRMDQMVSYYTSVRKTLRWYKKVGIHIFQLLLYNSYMLYNKHSNRRLSYYDFRLAVLEEILPKKHSIAELRITKLGTKHFLEKIERKNQAKRVLRKRCRICWAKKIRKDSSYHCTQCIDKPGLCVGKCFVDYHKHYFFFKLD